MNEHSSRSPFSVQTLLNTIILRSGNEGIKIAKTGVRSIAQTSEFSGSVL